jgi:hypothetical protein
MKKRNKKWLKEKALIRLQKELDKNRQAQRNLGWIELENPRFIGWIAKFNPRKDIQNREDAWIFWEICEKLGTVCHARKIDLFDWNKKKRRNMIISYPSIKDISEDYYLGLPPQVRKYFTEDTHGNYTEGYRRRWGKWYYCTVPNFFWEIVYEKEYQTKVKVIDEILLQEESEIEWAIERGSYNKSRYWGGVPKGFRKGLNRRERSKLKMDLHLIKKGEEPEYVPNFRGAAWLYW